MGLTYEDYKKIKKRAKSDIAGASVYARKLSKTGSLYIGYDSILVRGESYIIKEYKDREDGVLMEVVKV